MKATIAIAALWIFATCAAAAAEEQRKALSAEEFRAAWCELVRAGKIPGAEPCEGMTRAEIAPPVLWQECPERVDRDFFSFRAVFCMTERRIDDEGE